MFLSLKRKPSLIWFLSFFFPKEELTGWVYLNTNSDYVQNGEREEGKSLGTRPGEKLKTLLCRKADRCQFYVGHGKVGRKVSLLFLNQIWWEGNLKNGERTGIRDIVTRGRKQITELKKSWFFCICPSTQSSSSYSEVFLTSFCSKTFRGTVRKKNKFLLFVICHFWFYTICLLHSQLPLFPKLIFRFTRTQYLSPPTRLCSCQEEWACFLPALASS